MSTSLTLACLWVLAATCVAFLPMRWQFAPGIVLLIVAIPLLGFIGTEHNPWLVLAGVAAILSMFRRPLGYFLRKGLRSRGAAE